MMWGRRLLLLGASLVGSLYLAHTLRRRKRDGRQGRRRPGMLSDAVSDSALRFAGYRALESVKEGALFKDPLAAELAGPDLLEELKSRGGGVDRFAVRTHWVDTALCSGVDLACGAPDPEGLPEAAPSGSLRPMGTCQVVILGCGMDARAWRLLKTQQGRSSVSTLFEVDQADVMAAKEGALSRLDATGRLPPLRLCSRRAAVPANLMEGGWLEALQAAGFRRGEPTVWVMEGLLMYLSSDAVEALVKGMYEASCKGSSIVCTGVTEGAVQRAQASSSDLMRAWKWGSDDPAAYFAQRGWSCVTLTHGNVVAEQLGRLTWTQRTSGTDAPSLGPWYFHASYQEGGIGG